MAVLAIRLEEKGRKFLVTSLLLLNVTNVVFSFITTIIGIAVAIVFHQQRDIITDFNYSRLNFLIIFSGLALTTFHLFGAKMSFDCGNSETRGRSLKFMLIFLGVLFVALGLIIAVSISTSVAISELTKGYEKGFREFMDAYDADKTKRMEIDLLQITNKCCGSKSYKDWMEITWYPDEFVRPEMRGRKERGVPFTCCNPEYMGPCLHDSGGKARPGYQKAGEESFYPDGCADVVTVNLRWWLNKLSLWLILPMWLEVIIMIGTKYLHTSINNAAEAGDDEGPGYGYLLQKCPCTCLEFLECDVTPTTKKKKSEN